MDNNVDQNIEQKMILLGKLAFETKRLFDKLVDNGITCWIEQGKNTNEARLVMESEIHSSPDGERRMKQGISVLIDCHVKR
jgi:hypothetical protein